MESHDPQLLKGVLGLVLLRLLAERESYGYELVTRIHALGLVDVPDGSVYPALARLERDGSLVSRLVASQGGPARKYYRLSPKGLETLERGTRAWIALVANVSPLLTTTPKTERTSDVAETRNDGLGARPASAPRRRVAS